MEATLTEADARGMEGGSAHEADLIKACQEGDQTAFNLLVWRWEKPLFNFTYKYVGDAHLAQDLVRGGPRNSDSLLRWGPSLPTPDSVHAI